MYDSMFTLLLTIAATGAGLMAGVYFAFSCFIMGALDELGSARATEAMNSINRVILRSGFMAVFFGSTLLYAVIGSLALFDSELEHRLLLGLTSILYIAGMFGCTAVFNVPLNNQLASGGEGQASSEETWTYYLKYWTRWNHLRGACSTMVLALSCYYLFITC